MKRISFFIMVAMLMISCNKNEVITTELPPEIVLENTSGVFTTKVNRPITISPSYKYVDDALYLWSVENFDGYIQSVTDPTFTFTSNEVGSYYVHLEVSTEYGCDEEEMRIDVVEREIPTISMPASQRDYTILQGTELRFAPLVKETSIPTTYCWKLNGEIVGDEIEYTFVENEPGNYILTFTTENEDGSDEIELHVNVCTSEQMPFSWTFEQTVYNYAKGRSIRIMPTEVVNGGNATYTWKVDGEIVQTGESPMWICSIEQEGTYQVNVIASVVNNDSQITLSQELVVNVCPAEGTYHRPATAASSPLWNEVYQYIPAPGQFINETKTGGFDGSQTTHAAACLYAQQRMNEGSWVSLGGFGGYIVVGFDHSVENIDGYDFAILGNTFSGSSEPGVVWVMQDENGNSQPDDTWYELRGSETGSAGVVQEYAVTYYRPSAASMPVQWVDNHGNSGAIDYLAQFHTQDYYYPLWVESESYTLRGTLLESKAYDTTGSGMNWVLPEYDWGYADNYSPIDCNREGDKANNLDIDNAIDYAGNSVHLQYVDFVKVQTATNVQCGWIGENSTEVCGFYDCQLSK